MFFLRGDKLVIHRLHEVAGIIVSLAFFDKSPKLVAVDCFGVFFEGFDQGDDAAQQYGKGKQQPGARNHATAV